MPNGDLASGSKDGNINIWDRADNNVKQILAGHTDTVNALSVFPNGDLVSGSKDKTINIWNTHLTA